MRTGEGAPPIDALIAEIRDLSVRNRVDPDRARERQLVQLREQAGRELLASSGALQLVEPDPTALAESVGPPELTPDQLSAGAIRAGILRNGCVIVRGLLESGDALTIAEGIDRAMAAGEAVRSGGAGEPGYYEPYEPEVNQLAPFREFVERSGVFAVDAPKLLYDVLDLFDRTGVLRLVGDYLGEPPVISAHKTMLRKVTPGGIRGWHQDGSFMHNTRALNLWVALTPCGEDAPGLDIVPKRLDDIVVLHEDMLKVKVSDRKTEAAAGPEGIARPIFEAGDALFFDEMMLHRTTSGPGMTKPRFALETWFFGASSFPSDYAPLAV